MALFIWLVILGIIIAVAIIFKITKIVFRILSIIFLIVLLGGATLAIFAYLEGQQLKEDLNNSTTLLFYKNNTLTGGVRLTDPPQFIDEQELSQFEVSTYEDTQFSKRELLLNTAILQNVDASLPYEQRMASYLIAFDDLLEKKGQTIIMKEYFAANITFVPEPWTFKFLRTQPLISPQKILSNSIMQKVAGIED